MLYITCCTPTVPFLCKHTSARYQDVPTRRDLGNFRYRLLLKPVAPKQQLLGWASTLLSLLCYAHACSSSSKVYSSAEYQPCLDVLCHLMHPLALPNDQGSLLAHSLQKTIRMESCSHLWSDPAHVRVYFLLPVLSSPFNLVPTRLFALKHGASLVWGPEVVDKAILHAKRVVDRTSVFLPAPSTPCFNNAGIQTTAKTGVVSYDAKSRSIFTTHPIENPYLIYQNGSATPEISGQAA